MPPPVMRPMTASWRRSSCVVRTFVEIIQCRHQSFFFCFFSAPLCGVWSVISTVETGTMMMCHTTTTMGLTTTTTIVFPALLGATVHQATRTVTSGIALQGRPRRTQDNLIATHAPLATTSRARVKLIAPRALQVLTSRTRGNPRATHAPPDKRQGRVQQPAQHPVRRVLTTTQMMGFATTAMRVTT